MAGDVEEDGVLLHECDDLAARNATGAREGKRAGNRFSPGPGERSTGEAYRPCFVGLDEFEERRIASQFAWSQGRATNPHESTERCQEMEEEGDVTPVVPSSQRRPEIGPGGLWK